MTSNYETKDLSSKEVQDYFRSLVLSKHKKIEEDVMHLHSHYHNLSLAIRKYDKTDILNEAQKIEDTSLMLALSASILKSIARNLENNND